MESFLVRLTWWWDYLFEGNVAPILSSTAQLAFRTWRIGSMTSQQIGTSAIKKENMAQRAFVFIVQESLKLMPTQTGGEKNFLT